MLPSCARACASTSDRGAQSRISRESAVAGIVSMLIVASRSWLLHESGGEARGRSSRRTRPKGRQTRTGYDARRSAQILNRQWDMPLTCHSAWDPEILVSGEWKAQEEYLMNTDEMEAVANRRDDDVATGKPDPSDPPVWYQPESGQPGPREPSPSADDESE